jgi:hypothetical protein
LSESRSRSSIRVSNSLQTSFEASLMGSSSISCFLQWCRCGWRWKYWWLFSAFGFLLNLPAFHLTIYFGPFLGLEAQYKTSWSIILCCPPPSSSLFRQNAPTSFASTHSLIANLVVLCNFGNCTQLIKIKIQVLNW